MAAVVEPTRRAADQLLAMRGIHKRYGGVHALRGADLTIGSPGTVHSLMGENGSGKSTLLGVLSGQVRADAGTIALRGTELSHRGPGGAVSQGIVMVTQETAVAPDLSVAENVLLGRGMVRGARGIDWKASRRKARGVLERLELDYDPAVHVSRMRPDERQMIEIARAISMDARVLILDEPTSSLTDDQVEGLFKAVRQLTATGVATLFVSHRLDEVLEISDAITVLRDGITVAGGAATQFDRTSLVEAMVGDPHSLRVPHRRREALQTRPVALSVRDVVEPGVLRDVSLDVHEGEIVGLAGLVGAGRSELLQAVFGVRKARGTTQVAARDGDPSSVRQAIATGLGYLPPDRKSQGLVLSMSVAENLIMAVTNSRGRWRRPMRAPERAMVDDAMSSMRIRAASPDVIVSTLSGGNQQKVAIGKWILRSPAVLLLDEPTRGVDVGAKAEIHHRLRELADRGMAIVVSSSENEELLDLCDRIVVMARGAIVADLPRAEADEKALSRLTRGA
jgi:ABC-type sugar transport system ATPase subunit